jgi:hypothetical protein
VQVRKASVQCQHSISLDEPIFVMRKSIALLLLTMFACILPLQAYAQTCAMHCAFGQMQTDEMQEMSMQHGQQMPDHAPAHVPDQAPDRELDHDVPCTQSTMCQLAQGVQFSVLPVVTTTVILVAASSPSATVIKPLLSRDLLPLDRPPISA